MPLNNKEHHQQESSFSCLRHDLKKWIVSAHKVMRAWKTAHMERKCFIFAFNPHSEFSVQLLVKHKLHQSLL